MHHLSMCIYIYIINNNFYILNNLFRIVSIYDKETSLYFGTIVPFITILNELISGKSRVKSGKIKTQRIWLHGLIQYSMKLMNIENAGQSLYNTIKKKKKKWSYTYKLWECFTKNITKTIILDFDIIINEFKKLIQRLIEQNLLFVKQKEGYWIEPLSFISTFPNVKNILIKNCKIKTIDIIIQLLKESIKCESIKNAKLQKITVEMDIADKKNTIK